MATLSTEHAKPSTVVDREALTSGKDLNSMCGATSTAAATMTAAMRQTKADLETIPRRRECAKRTKMRMYPSSSRKPTIFVMRGCVLQGVMNGSAYTAHRKHCSMEMRYGSGEKSPMCPAFMILRIVGMGARKSPHAAKQPSQPNAWTSAPSALAQPSWIGSPLPYPSARMSAKGASNIGHTIKSTKRGKLSSLKLRRRDSSRKSVNVQSTQWLVSCDLNQSVNSRSNQRTARCPRSTQEDKSTVYGGPKSSLETSLVSLDRSLSRESSVLPFFTAVCITSRARAAVNLFFIFRSLRKTAPQLAHNLQSPCACELGGCVGAFPRSLCLLVF